MAAKNLMRLKTPTTALYVCDIQEKFRTAIFRFPALIATTKYLLDSAKVFEMPLLVSEQYPSGLGSTIPGLQLADIQNSISPEALSLRKRNSRWLLKQKRRYFALHFSLRNGIECRMSFSAVSKLMSVWPKQP